MYPLKISAQTMPYPSSILEECGKKAAMKPKRISTQSAPKRYGCHAVKSYLLWQAKSVRARKMPRVKMRAWRTMRDS